MLILGISAYYHDSAVCLLRDGELVCAIEEERLSRRKHDRRFPLRALRHCLKIAGARIHDLDIVAFYENPTKKLARQIWMSRQPDVTAALRRMVLGRLDPGRFAREIREVGGHMGSIELVDHHEAHAASSFLFSGFREAAIMTCDGVGEWATTTYGRGDGPRIELFDEVHFPHSLGLLYSAITGYLGFEVNDGEYKVMGLAPYGVPRYVDQVRRLLTLEGEGQFRLNLQYFDLFSTDRMHSECLVELFGREARAPESNIEDFHRDVARSLQAVLEDVLLENVRHLHRRVPSRNLCMAGGVALNCVANAKLLRQGPFARMFVPPAAGDAGGALGAAALVHARHTGRRPREEALAHVYLGSAYSADEVARLWAVTGLRARDFRGRVEELLDATVDRLAAGKVVGWFSGAMEFGPRALGARSILGDPRDPQMRDRINALVKKREAFRPFAPAVLAENAATHFELDHPSPFMLETCQVRSPLDLPAITHVDGSARVQTVDRTSHPRFSALIERFAARTGCPILLNTSFNMRGEPIVCSPEDALMCFARSGIDTLVLEDFILDRDALSAHQETVISAGAARRSSVLDKVYALL